MMNDDKMPHAHLKTMTVGPAPNFSGAPHVTPVPVNPQPTVSWVALTQPSALRYNGTTVQAVHAALRKAFGAFPIKLDIKDLPVLQGMVAAAGDGHTPFDILYDALEKFGEIEIRDK